MTMPPARKRKTTITSKQFAAHNPPEFRRQTQLRRTAVSKKLAAFALSFFASLLVISSAVAQTVDPSQFSDLHWRLVGPFRAGRSLSGTGVTGDPGTYYFGSVGGGVWKTTDAGMSWEPIFDKEPIAS